MIARALAATLGFCFQIHAPTPIQYAWAALTFANVVMMTWLAIRRGPAGFRAYMAVMAVCALIQSSTHWGLAGEIILAAATIPMIVELLPVGDGAVAFCVAIGVAVVMALWYSVPESYGKYPDRLFMTRLYTTAAFFGTALGSTVLPLWVGITWVGEMRWRVALVVPWFGAVLFAGMMPGKLALGKWTIGIIANATWTACLAGWLWIGKK